MGHVFGGFTPFAWALSNSGKADESQQSFLFTVKNPHGNTIRRFEIEGSGEDDLECFIWCGIWAMPGHLCL
jgi:O-glycosyl hydrolase